MKMKKLLVGAAISSCVVLSPVQAHAAEPASTAAVYIITKVKDKLFSTGLSIIGSKLFGSDGPQYVTLSEQSLRDIQRRVRAEIIRDNENEFIQRFDTLADLLLSYHNQYKSNTHDPRMLDDMFIMYKEIKNHRAIKANVNDDFFYMADTFAAFASVAVAIQAERYKEGRTSLTEVKRTANELADMLANMMVEKRKADLPIRSDCVEWAEDDDFEFAQFVEYDCSARDNTGYIIVRDVFDERWMTRSELWYDEKDRAIGEYMRNEFHSIEEVITELRRI